MNISIIGAGNMARGIGTRFIAGGNFVTVAGKDQVKATALAKDLRASKPGAEAVAATTDAALANDIIVLALPFAAARDFATANAAKLAGKVVIDITNPLNDTYDGLATAPGKSAAEELANLLPRSRVVKAFNTNFAGTLVVGAVDGHKLDVLVAGDDADAKAQVIALVEAGDLRGIDVGKLERARQLEGLALLGITLQGPLGTGFQSAWKLVA